MKIEFYRMDRAIASIPFYFLLMMSIFGLDGTVCASPATVDEWPMYRHGPQHTGQTATEGQTKSGPIWSFEVDDTITSSPAVAEGVVYFTSHDGNLYALDAKNGEKIWSYNLGDWGGFRFPVREVGEWLLSSPAVANDMVYVGSWDNKLYAIYKDGEEVWSFETGAHVDSSPCVADGVVYFGSRDKNVYALDASMGISSGHIRLVAKLLPLLLCGAIRSISVHETAAFTV